MTVSDVYNLQNEKVSEVELRDDIFGVPIKKHVLHQVVMGQLAKRRSGTAASKTRAAVKCSGSKLWRQKGTGRARVGSGSSPTRKAGCGLWSFSSGLFTEGAQKGEKGGIANGLDRQDSE